MLIEKLRNIYRIVNVNVCVHVYHVTPTDDNNYHNLENTAS